MVKLVSGLDKSQVSLGTKRGQVQQVMLSAIAPNLDNQSLEVGCNMENDSLSRRHVRQF